MVVVTMMRMIIINITKMMIRPTFCECTKLCMSGEFLKKSDQALLVNIRGRLVIKILWDSLIWKWEMKKHFFALFCTITLILANIQPCRMFSYSVWRLSAGWDGWHNYTFSTPSPIHVIFCGLEKLLLRVNIVWWLIAQCQENWETCLTWGLLSNC